MHVCSPKPAPHRPLVDTECATEVVPVLAPVVEGLLLWTAGLDTAVLDGIDEALSQLPYLD